MPALNGNKADIPCTHNNVGAHICAQGSNMNPYIADDILIVLDKITPTQNILFIGNGATLHKNTIKEKFQNKAYFSANNEQTSISIGKCAYHKFLSGQIDSADSITPLYLRKSQAERMQNIGKP